MMKSLIPVTLVLTTAIAGHLLPDAAISPHTCAVTGSRTDTLPDENFGEPLGKERVRDPRADWLQTRSAPRKVIPVIKVETDSTYTSLLKIPEEYTGYKIEIKAVPEELPPGHDLFFHHGNLSMEMLPDSTYSYTLGNFAEQEAAERFLKEALKARYPDAKVVQYQQGERNEQE